MKYVIKIRAIDNRTNEIHKFYYRAETILELKSFLSEFEEYNTIQTKELFKDIGGRLIRTDDTLLLYDNYDTKKERKKSFYELIIMITALILTFVIIVTIIGYIIWSVIK